MMKLYTEKYPSKEQPKQETIQFLLNYSKALRIVKTESKTFELHLN